MSGVRFNLVTAPVAVAASTTKTILQISAAANHRVKVERIRISGDSVVAADIPVEWVLYRQTALATGTAMAPVPYDEDATEVIQADGIQGASSEPAGTTKVWGGFISPLGSYDIVFPPGRELYISGGSWLGVTALTPNDINDFIVSADCEE